MPVLLSFVRIYVTSFRDITLEQLFFSIFNSKIKKSLTILEIKIFKVFLGGHFCNFYHVFCPYFNFLEVANTFLGLTKKSWRLQPPANLNFTLVLSILYFLHKRTHSDEIDYVAYLKFLSAILVSLFKYFQAQQHLAPQKLNIVAGSGSEYAAMTRLSRSVGETRVNDSIRTDSSRCKKDWLIRIICTKFISLIFEEKSVG